MKTWNYSYASRQGIGHKKGNTPCQDHSLGVFANETTVVAVSDGAGSKPLSHIGSEVAVKTVCQLLSESFDLLWDSGETGITEEVLSAFQKNLEEVKKEGTLNQAYASTLLFIAIKDQRFIAGHIGDGVIGSLTDDGELQVVSHPENGEFDNITYFITEEDAFVNFRVQKGKIDKRTAFILMSDGVDDSLYIKSEKALATANRNIMDWINEVSSGYQQEELNTELGSIIEEYFLKRSPSLDDCSLALIGCAKATNEEASDNRVQAKKASHKLRVKLNGRDHDLLANMLKRLDQVDVLKRNVKIITMVNEGEDGPALTDKSVSDILEISESTVQRVRRSYAIGGFFSLLGEGEEIARPADPEEMNESIN